MNFSKYKSIEEYHQENVVSLEKSASKEILPTPPLYLKTTD
jgi:hypothetical protein